ncbi:RsmB/NOP family class I SAM-dependent RNA methyltransferase [Chitinophaga japonensis]|uniref:16S rRNA (Cytosine967-C5)-methyltransferase n=1 Tax=Chitinophaga japonensis TaxID=104662 RepID=A0A562SJB3_CHIJA|nr:RsmB/NOP family class I SAM-dependent RNA methyltransferase [Chitinophaga japonensis]TWI80880.1 16S rRNA (cytosine967-C5)-methyltransferase [Chitinophaga japonensis]
MTRWENYLLSAEHIVHAYDGALPLHHFLKTFFRERPKMGSRDRRWVSQLVYAFYRLGHLWKAGMPVPERILLGQFLCATQEDELLAFFRPEWNEKAGLPVTEKLALVSRNGQPPTMEGIFPFVSELSEGIAPQEFVPSFFTQPRLFIRVRKNKQDAIAALLQQTGVAFEWQAPDVLSLPNGTKTETIIPQRDWYEVQDASSRQTGRLFQPGPGQRWWDCCAASGGKSLLLLDQEPGVQLTVSDIRPSILHNLQQRFAAAGIHRYESRVLDLAQPVPPSIFGRQLFDGIILDAPCSGSGTWGRTPENLYFFRQEQIAVFQALQRRIAANVIPLLKPGGTLIYITCSVFRQENEAVVQHLCESTGLQRQAGGIIPGYMHGADTMFANVLVKP